MPRGSRFLDEPTLYVHPETDRRRTATTKVEAVQFEADGYRKAADVQADEEHETRVAVTRAKNAKAPARKAAAKPAAAKPAAPVEVPDGAAAADASATETTEPNSGSAE